MVSKGFLSMSLCLLLSLFPLPFLPSPPPQNLPSLLLLCITVINKGPFHLTTPRPFLKKKCFETQSSCPGCTQTCAPPACCLRVLDYRQARSLPVFLLFPHCLPLLIISTKNLLNCYFPYLPLFQGIK